MTIQEIEQKLREMDDEFKLGYNELLKALAELKESKTEGKWKPAMSENYWFRNDYGDVDFCQWCDTDIDNWRYNNLPTFKTQSECERYWHFMDTVKEKSYEFSKLEWEDVNIRKYYIFYSYNNTYFKVHSDLRCKDLGTIYFKTEEDAQYIIDNFKDELMEFWI